jgi:hypothetical protein
MEEIQLNFLPLDQSDFEFYVYRKPYDQAKILDADLHTYKLPADDGNYKLYYVSFTERAGFDRFECTSATNNLLTVRFIGELLLRKAKSLRGKVKFLINESQFSASVDVVLKEVRQGRAHQPEAVLPAQAGQVWRPAQLPFQEKPRRPLRP